MNQRLTLTAAGAAVLASTALSPLIQGGAWFRDGAGAVIVVAAAGAGTRQRRLRVLPAAGCLGIALAGLVVYLNLVCSPADSWLRVVPTGDSLGHLVRLAGQGIAAARQDPAPAPAVPGLVLLATAGIGVAGALTDLVAVRLRCCALAGVPLLALLIAPDLAGAARSAVGTGITFCLGVAGYLSLLGAGRREHLRLWGQRVSPRRPGPGEVDAGPDTRALAAAGRRAGLAAVVLALFAPLVVPGLRAHRILSGQAGSGPAVGRVSGALPAPLVQMTKDLRESRPATVLTYHSSDLQPHYLQVYVLSNLSAATGTMPPPGVGGGLPRGGLPPVPGLRQGPWAQVRTSVTIRPGIAGSVPGYSFLPLPYPARVLDVRGNWRVDPGTLMVYSASQPLSGLTYTVTSDEVIPSPQQLARSSGPPPLPRSFLAVPPPLRSLSGLAKKITKGAATPFARALALQNWLRTSGGFTYSLNVPAQPAGAAALTNFLLVTKHGYCEQFALAMAVLARLVGIPSRIAVGYTGGTSQGNGNMVVKTSDEHAWPELYFTGFGWLPWEPTPAGAAVGQGTAVAPPYTITPGLGSDGGPGPPGGGRAVPRGSGLRPGRRIPGPRPPGRRQIGSGAGGILPPPAPHGTGLLVPLTVLGTLLAAALSGPRVARSVTRRRRWRTARDDAGRAHAAWLEFLDDLADHGIGRGPGETPRALIRRITTARQLPGPARDALRRLAQAEERASYARQPAASGTLPADVAAVRGGVSAAARPAARWRARLMPASVLARARETLLHRAGPSGPAEPAAHRARAWLPRARPADGYPRA